MKISVLLGAFAISLSDQPAAAALSDAQIKQKIIQESIDSYNRLIERAGVFGEEFQDWDESSV